jgi:phage terminase small subunit
LHGTFLENRKHEKFAQEYARGLSQAEAYTNAGYKTTGRRSADTCATRLLRNVEIRKRINELQRYAADSANLTVATLLNEAASIQRDASRDGNHSAAVAALTAKAKIAGLWVEKTETENVNLNYSISDQLPTEAQWEAERVERKGES